jgi:regulator of sigma E protease
MEGLGFALVAIVLFIVILGGLVLVHELGHYVSARALGVRVLEFGVGFPPRARVLRAKGETLWTLNWLPIGGFVRLEGEDGDASGDPRSFSAKPLRVRLAVLVSGVLVNVVLAFVIFFVIALAASPVIGVKIGEVDPGSPAAAAGLQPNDRIFGVAGQRFEFFGDEGITQALRARAGETIQLDIVRADGTPATVSATLRPPEQLSETVGALGIRGANGAGMEVVYSGEYVGHDVGRAFDIASNQLTQWGGLILRGLGQLVEGFVRDPTAPPPASGPVGIAFTLADIFIGNGLILTLYVAAILSVNLGVVNILPFPPLDGGRMAVLVIKRLFGSRISLRAERLTYAIGFVVLMAFILWVTGFDLVRLGTNP